MPAVKAPRGGIVISGRRFNGGQWIPAGVVAANGGAPTPKKQFPAGGHDDLLTRLALHKREMDPKQLESLKRVHDALKSHHGDGLTGRLKADADALEKAHGQTKDEGHKATLKHHLGNVHALAEMAKGGAAESPKEPKGQSSSGAPTQTATMGKTINVVKSEQGFTASFKDKSQPGQSQEEAVGKLVMENADALGLQIKSEESTQKTQQG